MAHIPFPVSPFPHVPYTWGDVAAAACCVAGTAGTSIPPSSNWGVVPAAGPGGGAGAADVVAVVGESGDGSTTTGPRFPTLFAQCSTDVPQYPYPEQHSELFGHIAFPTDPEPHVPYSEGAAPPVDGAEAATDGDSATDDDDDDDEDEDEDEDDDAQCSGSVPQYP